MNARRFFKFNSGQQLGFTLIELMIAMTITLLLMAALGKAFAVIGESMKSGRSQVSLSSKLRGISFRIRSDLRSRTVMAQPPVKTSSGRGYFMCYEGPLTEQTYGMYGAAPARTLSDETTVFQYDPRDSANIDSRFLAASNAPTFRQHSRLGDFDDYIAFTATAPGDDWFTGKVPAYLVDDNATDPMAPTIIRSKYAEVIIWASPEWAIDGTANTLLYPPNRVAFPQYAMPMYRDDNQDYVPDRIVLHQRILLIRPDLNVSRSIPNANPLVQFETEVLRPFGNNANPATMPLALRRIYPIGQDNAGTTTKFPDYARTQSQADNSEVLQSNWLIGMTPLHQFFDLSLRRIVHPVTGEPTGYVAANGLEDLVQPHNRFAHVRYPGRYFGLGNFSSADAANDLVTSMPLLATGWNSTILDWQGVNDLYDVNRPDPRAETAVAAAPTWFPIGPPSPGTLNVGNNSSFGLFNGWLLPHFELGDPNPAAPTDQGNWKRDYLATTDTRWDRTGEDVIASNILAFDLRGFDALAPIFATAGPDGEAGRAGVDDDGVGGIDILAVTGGDYHSEVGAIGSDDVVIGVGDLAIRDLVGLEIFDPEHPPAGIPAAASSLNRNAIVGRGDFVDLFYPYLAGTPLLRKLAEGGLATVPPFAEPTAPQTILNYDRYFRSELSGLGIAYTGLSNVKRSGRLLHYDATGRICFFQPAYDTWTDGYESDGFDQTHDRVGSISPGTAFGSHWVLYDVQANVQGKNARLPTPAAAPVLFSIDTGRYLDESPETSPPINANLRAVEVTVRVGDPVNGEMTQFSIVEGLQ